MSWIVLFIAGLFEIGWAIGLKYTEGFSRLWPSLGTALAMVLTPQVMSLWTSGVWREPAMAGHWQQLVLMAVLTQWRDGLFASVAMHAVRRLAYLTFVHMHELSLRFHLRLRGGKPLFQRRKDIVIEGAEARPLTAAATCGKSSVGCGSGFARIARISPTRARVR